MSKVILTKEQAEAVERYKGDQNTLDGFCGHFYAYMDSYKSLNGLTLDEMARAMYGTYEVEEDIKVDDWVKVNWSTGSPSIRKVTYVTDDYVWLDSDQGNKIQPKEIVEHANPEEIKEEKQRRWWTKHGRKVWELKERDIVKNSYGFIREIEKENGLGEYVTLPNYTPFNKKELRDFRVVCFAEDRKDLGSDS